MEKERSSKVIAIVALLIGVIGLSIGFAAFSNTLTIKSSAEVVADEGTFSVDFSNAEGEVVAGTVTSSNPEIGAAASISNDGNAPIISGLKATFTAPGQEVTYEFWAHNNGEYLAYLKSIAFANVGETTELAKTKVCSVAEDSEATAGLVSAACDGISLTVSVGTETNVTESKTGITNHTLAKGAAEKVIVKIAYAEGAQRPDGNITVQFGYVSLGYSSAD